MVLFYAKLCYFIFVFYMIYFSVLALYGLFLFLFSVGQVLRSAVQFLGDSVVLYFHPPA